MAKKVLRDTFKNSSYNKDKNMKRIALLAAVSCALLGNSTNAVSEECSPNSGFYIGGFGGVNMTNVKDLKSEKSDEIDINVKREPGFTGAAAVGYKFQTGFRTELEVAYRKMAIPIEIDLKIADSYERYAKINHDIEAFSGMANVYYDFDCFNLPVTPYIGVGAGVAKIVRSTSLSTEYFEDGSDYTTCHTRGVYQAIAGLSYKVCDKTELSLEYRYFDTIKHSSTQNHSIGLGLKRYF